MLKTITEGKARVKVPTEEKISSKLPVFYNPVMKFNRDVSVLLLKAIDKKAMQIGLPLAASGVRGIRFLLELPKSKIKTVFFNDNKKDFKKTMAANLKLNKIGKSKVEVHNKDANRFMLDSTGFDYIDIDPFGTPNPFLDAAVRRIARNGILAVTATDTSALCGSFTKACLRKYWAVPVNNEQMYEVGLRILIRKVQLIGAQFDKALIPIFSYSKDHYMRVFFRAEKGKQKVDEIIKLHNHFQEAGPLWTGQLWDTKLVTKMIKETEDRELIRFLKIIKAESKISTVGYYDTHTIYKKQKNLPRKQDLIKKIKKKGFKASETHFLNTAIKSDITKKELLKLI